MAIDTFEKSYMTRSTKGKPRKTISHPVEKFDYEKFSKLPNAAEFMAKIYDQCESTTIH